MLNLRITNTLSRPILCLSYLITCLFPQYFISVTIFLVHSTQQNLTIPVAFPKKGPTSLLALRFCLWKAQCQFSIAISSVIQKINKGWIFLFVQMRYLVYWETTGLRRQSGKYGERLSATCLDDHLSHIGVSDEVCCLIGSSLNALITIQ